MESNLIRLMSIAMGALIFVFGLSVFMDMYTSFMTNEAVYDDRISYDETIMGKSYDNGDIFYSYSRIKEIREDEEYDKNTSTYVDIIVDGVKLDFTKEEDDMLLFLSSFAGKNFKKTYSFNGEKIKEIIYTSR